LHQDEIVGIGKVVRDMGELRACYVSPYHGGKGIGRAIVRELERIARSNRIQSLWLDSSLTAEAFYESLGYAVLERGEHMLGSGVKMACVKMSKGL
jgi:N-acetylglutamate synthase-like GNAT family acetyltransferase